MAILQAENAPLISAPTFHLPITPFEAAEGHETVTVYFDQQVDLLVEWGKMVRYTRGVHEVPLQWLESYKWVFEANDARIHTKRVAVDTPQKKANG